MQKRTPNTRTEPMMPLQATHNELIAVSAAITAYTRLLTHTPQSATENQDTIALLERFQRRLTQLPPVSTQQEGLYGQP